MIEFSLAQLLTFVILMMPYCTLDELFRRCLFEEGRRYYYENSTDTRTCLVISLSPFFMRLQGMEVKLIYTTLTNFSTKFIMLSKVYTDVCGIK